MSEIKESITLTIDGQAVTARKGDTVLQAAERAGIHIPTLCAHKDLSPFGACRMCIVEIDKVRGFPTSCTTPAADGMVVRTKSAELETLRNTTLELMMSGHPNACLVCDHRSECDRPQTKSGQSTRCGACSNRSGCAMREMALEKPTVTLNLPTLYSKYKVERNDPFIERDHNLCILCGKCWRVCEQLHGTPAISIINRGREARIGTAFDRSWAESGCTFCGACVDICPTGTITDRNARWYPGEKQEIASVCTLCDQACSMDVVVSQGQVVATKMTEFKQPSRLCALGRFAYPQLLSSSERLRKTSIREDGDLTPVPWDEATATIAAALKNYEGKFAVILGEPATREARSMYQQLAKALKGRVVSMPAGAGSEQLPADVRVDITSGRIEAVWTTGDYISQDLLDKLKYLVVADVLPSNAILKADAVLPVAVMAEAGGTVRTPEGNTKPFTAVVPAPGTARAETAILRDLAAAMGVQLSDAIASDADITPAAPAGDARDRLADLTQRFRGHLLADTVPALRGLGLPASKAPESDKQLAGYRVVSRDEIVPNFHKLVIEAPTVAKHAKPGQFAIVMVGQRSERVPFTLVDWDAEQGTITLVIEEVGRSSQEIRNLQAGDLISHVSGPLGLPLPIDKEKKTVVLGGGCYGIGAIYPVARAYKQAGVQVIAAIEGCSAHMLYMEEELR
jgi:NADH dehydrogenase/NADH:ubiquinone oxidoreductase subunit G